MDVEQELMDLGEIVLGLAKSLQKHEENMEILQTLVTENMGACLVLIDGLKRTALYQQEHITKLEQKIIHTNWAVEELEGEK